MSIDDDLAEADSLLKELQIDILTVCARAGFDGEGQAMDKMLEAVRLIHANVRLKFLALKEQL